MKRWMLSAVVLAVGLVGAFILGYELASGESRESDQDLHISQESSTDPDQLAPHDPRGYNYDAPITIGGLTYTQDEVWCMHDRPCWGLTEEHVIELIKEMLTAGHVKIINDAPVLVADMKVDGKVYTFEELDCIHMSMCDDFTPAELRDFGICRYEDGWRHEPCASPRDELEGRFGQDN